MKFLIILALMVGCSMGKKKESPAKAEGPESDAAQVSPYTVKPCLCMKIFKPVCANGVNYGNSCEAECQGQKKWTEGSCPQTKKK